MEENDLAKLEWPVPQRVVKWFGANVGSFGYRKIVSVPTDEMYRDMSAPISNETLTDTWRRVHIVERGFELVKELSLHDAAALFEMIDDLLNAKGDLCLLSSPVPRPLDGRCGRDPTVTGGPPADCRITPLPLSLFRGRPEA